MACELYCCLLPQCEALRTCRSGFSDRSTTNMRRLVNQKLSDLNIKGDLKFCPVMALSSTPAKNLLISFNKNIPRPHLTLFPLPSATTLPIYFSQTQIYAVFFSFSHGSGAGPEGLRPHHLKDCLSISAGDADTSLLASLTELVNYLMDGHLPTAHWPLLYGAQLHGLHKSNGDLGHIL